MKSFSKSFYDKETIDVAKGLLGCMLVYKIGGQPRIGVDYAGQWASWLYRFHIDENSRVSKRPAKKKLQARQGA